MFKCSIFAKYRQFLNKLYPLGTQCFKRVKEREERNAKNNKSKWHKAAFSDRERESKRESEREALEPIIGEEGNV
jgi:hypothetical protein